MRIETVEPTAFAGGVTREPSPSLASSGPEDGLDAFAAESAPLSRVKAERRWIAQSPVVTIALGVACLAAGMVGSTAYQRLSGASRQALLTIETEPNGLDVTIDGASRGRTPLTLTLPPRSYEVAVGRGADKRVIKAVLVAGGTVVQRLEMPAAAAQTEVSRGVLRIDTEPSGRTIQVDGIERGASPLTLKNLTAGDHVVTALNGREPIARRVTVRAGETVSLLLSAPVTSAPIVSAGWFSVRSPIELQIREGGKLLGSTESERLMAPAGNHTIDLVNAELGFTARRAVSIAAGKLTALQVDVPNGSLSLNAQPWAEVWVDGTRVGETPIGNLARPIGRHEVIFRHPELGERREVVMVTMLQPARLGIDLKRKTP